MGVCPLKYCLIVQPNEKNPFIMNTFFAFKPVYNETDSYLSSNLVLIGNKYLEMKLMSLERT